MIMYLNVCTVKTKVCMNHHDTIGLPSPHSPVAEAIILSRPVNTHRVGMLTGNPAAALMLRAAESVRGIGGRSLALALSLRRLSSGAADVSGADDAAEGPIRDPRFARLEPSDVAHFERILGPGGVVQGTDDLATYNRDWMGKYEGASALALRPRSTEEVSAILSHCHARRLAVVPQGGNTGLVGGSVPVFDEIVLSTSRMNRIESVDALSGAVVCEAGCVLETLDNHVAAFGLTAPLDLGAKGSCQIGGNVATNAGGIRFVKHGSLFGSVLGLEIVLADGTVLPMENTLKKDNTGYALSHAFIGSEGTLGVITKVGLLCPPKPAASHVCLLQCESFADVLSVLGQAKRLGAALCAIEFFDAESVRLVQATHPAPPRFPFDGDPAGFFVLIETEQPPDLEPFLPHVQDGVVAQSADQATAFWRMREGIPEALNHQPKHLFKYDVSLPTSRLYALVEACRARLASWGEGSREGSNGGRVEDAAVVGYGHLGDGNLHLNVAGDARMLPALEPWVYERVREEGGSVSAEHGIGRMKKAYLGYSKSEAAIGVMRKVKALFDPHDILNPYKVL